MDSKGRFGWPLSASLFEFRFTESVLEDIQPDNVLDPYSNGTVPLACAYNDIPCTALSYDPFTVDMIKAKTTIFEDPVTEDPNFELLLKSRMVSENEDESIAKDFLLDSLEPQPCTEVSVYECDPRDMPCPVKGFDFAMTFLPRFTKTDPLKNICKTLGYGKRGYPEGEVLPVELDGMGDKDLERLGRYLSDLKDHFTSLRYALNPGSEACYVISNTSVSGTYIFFEELVPPIIEECGFVFEDAEKIRVRDARRGAEDFQLSFRRP